MMAILKPINSSLSGTVDKLATLLGSVPAGSSGQSTYFERGYLTPNICLYINSYILLCISFLARQVALKPIKCSFAGHRDKSTVFH